LSRGERPPRAAPRGGLGFALYLRQGEAESGPYPRGLLERYVELGRVRPGDELSEDGLHWHPAASMLPGLTALESAPAADPAQWDVERRRARLRWIEERGGAERRRHEGDAIQIPVRSSKDRRSTTSRSIPPRPDDDRDNPTRWKRWNSAFAVLGLVVGVVLVALLLSTLAPGLVIRFPSPGH
jgi:hypothetical protein